MAINWKKTVFVVCDIVIAAYLLLAITAFNKPGAITTHCTEVKIDIEQNSAISGFMNANDIHSHGTWRMLVCVKLKKHFKKVPLSRKLNVIRRRAVMSA